MKKLYIILATFGLCLISCNKIAVVEDNSFVNNDSVSGMKMVTIKANFEEPTKTSYADDPTNPGVQLLSWAEGDEISVRCSDGKFYTLAATSSGASTYFSGAIPAGATLCDRAYFPADANHTDTRFSIAKEKDMTAHPSADLPMVGTKGADGVFTFTHCSGAARLTVENIPNDITSIKISITNASLNLSGLFSVVDGASAGLYCYEPEDDDQYGDKVFIRTVGVSSNTAQVYLPYSCHPDYGNMWASSTLSIVGYKNDNTSVTLLTGKNIPALGTFQRAHVIPLKPLILSQLGRISWGAISGYSGDGNYAAYKVTSDDYYVYFYTKVKKSALKWGTSEAGEDGTYIYYGIDVDSGATGTDYWGNAGIFNNIILVYPYRATDIVRASPYAKVNGVKTGISCQGTVGTGEDAMVETEIAVPRSLLGISTGTAVRVGSYASSNVSVTTGNVNVTL